MFVRVHPWPILLLLVLSLFLAGVFAQSPVHKRKKIKNFGSSLKRLKWDPQKNSAIATADPDNVKRNSGEEDVVRIETSLVTSEVLVLDRQGRNISGLSATDFVVTEDGEMQRVGHFLLGDNVSVPRTIVLIIDYSGSQIPYLRNSVDAAKVLVDKLGPLDRMAIVTDDVEMLVYFTDDKDKLKKKLESLIERTRYHRGFLDLEGGVRYGRSKQYSALMATLNEAFEDEDIRPIIVFQTDGDEAYFLRNPIIGLTVAPNLPPGERENAEREVVRRQQILQDTIREFSLEDVYRAAERSRATIYTIVPGTKLLGFTTGEQVERIKAAEELRWVEILAALPPEKRAQVKAREEENSRQIPDSTRKWFAGETLKIQSALSVVATLTGGWTEFLETPSQASEIYSRIFSDINQRYLIGYYPTNKEHDGKRRRIDFSVKGHPDYQILGRRSYFAPGPTTP